MPYRISPNPEAGVEVAPPSGGCWLRDADGGLTPADQETAQGAGLDWPVPAQASQQTQAPVAAKAVSAKE